MTRYVKTTAEIKGTTEDKLRRNLAEKRMHKPGRGRAVQLNGWQGNFRFCSADDLDNLRVVY